MVDKPKDNQLDSEIAKRLDDLFGEGDTPSDDENPVSGSPIGALTGQGLDDPFE